MILPAAQPQRLAKIIAASGLCSRKAASRLIDAGRVQLNGRQASHIDHVCPADTVLVDNQPLPTAEPRQYWLYHKPAGVDCNLRADDPCSLLHILQHLPCRLYPSGRLDKDSRGLLLLTNDGELNQRLLHPAFQHEKEYLVTVDKPLTPEFIHQIASGVCWQVGPRHYQSRPSQITQTSWQQFRLILTQGLNRQIRYMCRALGYKVTDLCRLRIENLQLSGLACNELLPLTGNTVNELRRRVCSRTRLTPQQQAEQ
ncbi:RNA pseudouridine synthase [Chromatiaceae bacterium AAb-1]|nr:RNA pseudouridine synthase [Chromatiaceae bacterium AAb-1]